MNWFLRLLDGPPRRPTYILKSKFLLTYKNYLVHTSLPEVIDQLALKVEQLEKEIKRSK